MPREPKQSLRTPPQDVDAERALLGSILLRPEAIYEVVDIITPESFYFEKHRLLFQVMLELYNRHEPVDLVALSTRLKENKSLEKVGGTSYIAQLVENVPSSLNAKHYATTVQRKHMMRQLIEASHYISELGFSEEEEIEELLDRAEKKIYDVTSSPTTQKFIALTDILGEAFERIDKLSHHENALRGVPTGFPELDQRLSGLQKSDLIILAARPSVGKTALALDIARKAAIGHKQSVGIFSLEMGSQQLVDRLLASESGIDSWNLRTGKLKNDLEYEQLREALDRLSHANIFIDDQPASNILRMRSIARRLKSEKGLDLIIVDYLQLMMPSGKFRSADSMVQQVTEISRSLKQLARELEVPVLALSQLSRAIEQRRGRPQLSDLRDSGSIEQDADVVMFIHNEDRYKEEAERSNIIELIIAKHRNGPTGTVELYFDSQRATFRSIEKHGLKEFESLPETRQTF